MRVFILTGMVLGLLLLGQETAGNSPKLKGDKGTGGRIIRKPSGQEVTNNRNPQSNDSEGMQGRVLKGTNEGPRPMGPGMNRMKINNQSGQKSISRPSNQRQPAMQKPPGERRMIQKPPVNLVKPQGQAGRVLKGRPSPEANGRPQSQTGKVLKEKPFSMSKGKPPGQAGRVLKGKPPSVANIKPLAIGARKKEKRECSKTFKPCERQGGECTEKGKCDGEVFNDGCKGDSCECCVKAFPVGFRFF